LILLFKFRCPEEADRIKNKLLIIPGYIIGLSCLLLVTYRTFLAFFSDSKSVLVHINRYGEQYLDLFALVIIWIITFIGLFYLIMTLKEERKIKNDNYKAEIKGIVADSVNVDE
jgi:hypothetical protein